MPTSGAQSQLFDAEPLPHGLAYLAEFIESYSITFRTRVDAA